MQNLINLPLRASAQPEAATAITTENTQSTVGKTAGVFITSQSVITFPIASTFVSIIWQVLGKVSPGWNNDLAVVIIALLVGGILFWQSESSATDTKTRVLSIFYALINAFTLAAAALGINTVTG